MSYTESSLWNATLAEVGGDPQQDSRKLLRDGYSNLRQMASFLVENINADLRQFTVHEITHLDALWNIASEIVGPDFEITPTEGFLLGASFLLHDAGMCLAAYPGGVAEIEKSKYWPIALRKYALNASAPTDEEHRSAIMEFLRAEHANRANELPRVEWTARDGSRFHLIEKVEIRQKFGQFIGEVAASHWWGHDKLGDVLDRIIPAPPPFPTEWHIDLLKVACILRVADAAHLDERRAPGFVWALRRQDLGEEADLHWTFQNRLTQPERRGDALYYSSTSDFGLDEAGAWWLAFDILQMADEELRRTDVLLADMRPNSRRFGANRIANIESTRTAVNSIQVVGWIPVDTKIKISDIPGLIKNLGGEALYGKNTSVPLRELVQNATDAIRLRSAVSPNSLPNGGKIKIRVGDSDGKYFLEVIDNGIGMTEEIVTSNLLDFGRAAWVHDPVFLDYPEVDPHAIKTIGRFGIGFFSVFMLGDRIEILTRRFDKGYRDTIKLVFPGGVRNRPILHPANQDEWLIDGGTSIRVWLELKFNSIADLFGRREETVTLKQICQGLFPTLDVVLVVDEFGKEDLIDCQDWRTLSGEQLVRRTRGTARIPKPLKPFCKNIRPVLSPDGQILARMFLLPDHYSYQTEVAGTVVANGIYAGDIYRIAGVAEGEITTAARNSAIVKFTPSDLASWLAEQADLISKMNLSETEQESAASTIRQLGGDIGQLKFCRTKDGWLSKSELPSFLSKHESIVIISMYELTHLINLNPTGRIFPNVIGVNSGGYYTIFPSGRYSDDALDRSRGEYTRFKGDSDIQLEGLIFEVAMDAWRLDLKMISEYANGIRGREYLATRLEYVVAETPDGIELKISGKKIHKGMSPSEFDEIVTKATLLRAISE